MDNEDGLDFRLRMLAAKVRRVNLEGNELAFELIGAADEMLSVDKRIIAAEAKVAKCRALSKKLSDPTNNRMDVENLIVELAEALAD